jgi:hypothetical protein
LMSAQACWLLFYTVHIFLDVETLTPGMGSPAALDTASQRAQAK